MKEPITIEHKQPDLAEAYCVWDSLAEKYDRLWVQNHSLAPTRNIVKNLILDHFGGADFTLLDVGCGTGQLLAELRECLPSCRLIGVDKSPAMIRQAQSRDQSIEVYCADADNDDLFRIVPEGSVDAVVCCHSFPYYKNKAVVLTKLYNILATGGIAVFAQASINNLYDKLILRAVEATAEKAEYLSRTGFRNLAEGSFEVMAEFSVHERFFMPSIRGFILRKRA